MRVLGFFVVLMAVYFSTVPTLAQGVVCAPRAVVLNTLQSNHDEVVVNRGLAWSGQVLEVAASPAGTWSLFFTRPDGTSCLVLSGVAWQAVVPRPPEQEAQ